MHHHWVLLIFLYVIFALVTGRVAYRLGTVSTLAVWVSSIIWPFTWVLVAVVVFLMVYGTKREYL